MVQFRLPHQRILHFFLCTIVITLVHQAGKSWASYERTCHYNSRPHSNGLCGSQLSNVMDFLCASLRSQIYNSKHRVRRSQDLMDSRMKAITLNPKDALSYLTKRGASGDIVCECCYNPCSQSELMQYCDLRIDGLGKRSMSTSLSPPQDPTVDDPLSAGYY